MSLDVALTAITVARFIDFRRGLFLWLSGIGVVAALLMFAWWAYVDGDRVPTRQVDGGHRSFSVEIPLDDSLELPRAKVSGDYDGTVWSGDDVEVPLTAEILAGAEQAVLKIHFSGKDLDVSPSPDAEIRLRRGRPETRTFVLRAGSQGDKRPIIEVTSMKELPPPRVDGIPARKAEPPARTSRSPAVRGHADLYVRRAEERQRAAADTHRGTHS